MTSVKFRTAPDGEYANRVEACAAVLWATIEASQPGLFDDDASLLVALPSSKTFVGDCLASSARAGWPQVEVAHRLLAEVRPRQTHLSQDERREAAAGKHSALGRLDGRRVLLVDDMYTSGFTMHDAARALADAGAASVAGVVFARRLTPDGMAVYREETTDG